MTLRNFWYRNAKNHTSAEVDQLRETIDDLWCAIGKQEIDLLQKETVLVAKYNHELLWKHAGESS